ncbi:SNF7 family protein [Babesia bovis T2Bo]|uniref:SNF7 family protein n=1 Tax=Babesia bovis TaxID=5865 RepID=A7AUN0_BABBO|nr:SNF7 family protein [Babesia bovis T2Bo]EDO06641.1 SNF7 family protein [Babesia bovis T2Bo]|eukprot:XP_001610209.1 SNF7 family protein [Babesia bovis T2Bo]
MGINQSSLTEQLREKKREINRSIRQLDRNRMRQEREESILLQRLKTEAKKGHMKDLRIIAKQLVRTRKMINQYTNLKSHLSAILGQVDTAHNTKMLSSSIKSVNSVFTKFGQKTDMVEFEKTLQSLGRESELMNLKLDIISESMDNTFQDVDAAGEEDLIIAQVLEELGIDGSEGIPSVNNVDLKQLKFSQVTKVPQVVCEPEGDNSTPNSSPGSVDKTSEEGHFNGMEDER